jgi:hypothetical protein
LQLAALAEQQPELQQPADEPAADVQQQPSVELPLDEQSPPDACEAPVTQRGSEQSPNAVNVTAPWEPAHRLLANADSDPNTLMDSPKTVEENLPAPGQPTSGDSSGHDASDVDRLVGRLAQAGLWRSGDTSENAGLIEATSAIGEARHSSVRQNSVSDSSVRQSSARQSSAGQSSVRNSNPPTAAGAPRASDPQAAFAAKRIDRDAEGRDDESIESYMDRLLKRVRSAPPSEVAKPQPAAPRATSPPPVPVAPAPSIPASGEHPVEELPEYLPRTAAPELPANLSAMRELANTAARTAIDRHVRTRTGRQAAGRLLSSSLTIATSVLLSYWAWRAHSLQAAVGAGIGGFVGLYWTLAALRRLFGAMRLSRPKPAA